MIIISVVVVVVDLVVEIDLYKFCRLQSRHFLKETSEIY